jgi:hypothetical protein
MSGAAVRPGPVYIMRSHDMKAFGKRLQRGQAIAEFIAAMAVFVPLFFGIVYVGKFADMKHQAIQASRYAAFERALVPSQTLESASVLEEETRARFFTDGSRNQGKIGFQDSTKNLATNGTLNPLWNEVNGTPLLNSYDDPTTGISVTVKDVGAFSPINEVSRVFNNLNRDGQIQADVEVPIANIAHLPAILSNLNLKVASRTVVAGDAWNGNGPQDVADHQSTVTNFSLFPSDIGRNNPVLQGLQLVLTPLALVFADSSPQFGCDRPDVVPAGTAPGANYQDGDPCY